MDQKCAFCEIFADKSKYQTFFKLRYLAVMFVRDSRRGGHMLIVPLSHVENIFEMSKPEWEEMALALDLCKFLGKERGAQGYNIVSNCGEAAGQKLMHAHVHVIPRFAGDSSLFSHDLDFD